MNERPAEDAFRVALIIWFALLGGVLAFAAIAFGLWQVGSVPMGRVDMGRDPAQVFLWVWLALALGSATASISFWRVKVAPLTDPRLGGAAPEPEPPTATRASELQTGLIICWALLEGAALAAIVFFVLFGAPLLLGLGLAYLLISFGLAAPKRDWFRPPTEDA